MKKFFILLFFLFVVVPTYAKSQIAFIDMEIILNKSLVGKKYINEINENKKKVLKKLKANEQSLIKEEKLLSSQKNVIKKGEFEVKFNLLKKKVNEHNKKKKDSLKDFNKDQIDMTSKLLLLINPILEEYSSKNSISILLQKRDIVIGNTNLDITLKILDLVNQKIKE